MAYCALGISPACLPSSRSLRKCSRTSTTTSPRWITRLSISTVLSPGTLRSKPSCQCYSPLSASPRPRQDLQVPAVHHDYIRMFIFLPTEFQDEFTRYIAQIITTILKALAEELEPRGVATWSLCSLTTWCPPLGGRSVIHYLWTLEIIH